MPGYRVFKLNKKGAIYGSHEMFCDTDDDALRRAAELAHDCPGYELWEGARKVGGFMNGIPQHEADVDVPVRMVIGTVLSVAHCGQENLVGGDGLNQ